MLGLSEPKDDDFQNSNNNDDDADPQSNDPNQKASDPTNPSG